MPVVSRLSAVFAKIKDFLQREGLPGGKFCN